MPTLSSIHVAKSLQERLAKQVTPSITTPLALLTRPSIPLGLSVQQWEQLQLSVANAVLVQSCQVTARLQQLVQQECEKDGSAGEGGRSEDKNELPLIVGSLTAREYWKHHQRHSEKLKASFFPILPWLQPDHINQLTGPHASGKTQVCLSLALHHLSQDADYRVLYITTNSTPGSLARRSRQLAGNKQVMLGRLHLTYIANPHSLLLALHHTAETNKEKPTLLIIDSVSACIVGGDWQLLQAVGIVLKQLVHIHAIPTVTTNGITSSDKAALGLSWTSVAETEVRLTVTSTTISTKTVQARLERHATRGPGETMDIVISGGGIKCCSETATQAKA